MQYSLTIADCILLWTVKPQQKQVENLWSAAGGCVLFIFKVVVEGSCPDNWSINPWRGHTGRRSKDMLRAAPHFARYYGWEDAPKVAVIFSLCHLTSKQLCPLHKASTAALPWSESFKHTAEVSRCVLQEWGVNRDRILPRHLSCFEVNRYG